MSYLSLSPLASGRKDAIIILMVHMEIGRCVIMMLGSGENILKFRWFDLRAHILPCFPSLPLPFFGDYFLGCC